MPEFVPSWKQPSHPTKIRVVKGEKDEWSTASYALLSLPPGAVFSGIEGSKPVARDAWNTVSTGLNTRIDLNSDLTYTNHSCDPSLVFDMQRMEVRVADHRPLSKGDELTFFYPSTEWSMAQPFKCRCGAEACLGYVDGAKDLSPAVLERYWLNEHIRDLLQQHNNGAIRTDDRDQNRTSQHV